MADIPLKPLIPESVRFRAEILRDTPESNIGWCFKGWSHGNMPFTAHYVGIHYHGENFWIYAITATGDSDLERITDILTRSYHISRQPVNDESLAELLVTELYPRFVKEFYEWYAQFVTQSN